jgi:hypothetical protein
MSNRKTLWFYALLIAVASLMVGMVIASRLDLSPESAAQTMRGTTRQQRAAQRPGRRDDVPEHRENDVPRRRQH